MNMKSIEYSKVFNLGNYSNEKIGVVIDLAPGDNPLDAFAEAKATVEKSHRFFTELPKYEQAKLVVTYPDNATGYQVKAAKKIIIDFEATFPDYLNKFMPANRELTEGPTEFEHNDY